MDRRYFRGGQFSPDGNLIAYSVGEAEEQQIFVKPFSDGVPVVVGSLGGSLFRWSLEGELIWLRADGVVEATHVDPNGATLNSKTLAKCEDLGLPCPTVSVSADGERFVYVRR